MFASGMGRSARHRTPWLRVRAGACLRRHAEATRRLYSPAQGRYNRSSDVICAQTCVTTGDARRVTRRFSRQEDPMDNLWLALFWTGPIGVGVFLAGLGVLFWGIAQAKKNK